MKKFLTLGVIQFFFLFTYAGSLDNHEIKVDNQTANDYLIVPLSDDGYLLVSRDNSSPGAMRLNSQGVVQWAKSFTSLSAPILYDAGVYPNGEIYIIYNVTVHSPYTQYNFITVKLNAQGAVQWATALPFDYMTYLQCGPAKPQADGSLIFTPSIFSEMQVVKLNANGTVGCSYIIIPDTTSTGGKSPCLDAEPTANGGMIVIGKEDSDPVITCITPTGSVDWVMHYSCGPYNRAYSIVRISDGNYLVGGLYSINYGGGAGNQAFLMKISPSGSIIWANRYAGTVDSAKSDILSGFTQLGENPDGSIRAIGFSSGEFNPTYHTEITVSLSNSGQPQSAYYYNHVSDYWDIQQRMYKGADGRFRISSMEPDGSYNSSAMLIDPDRFADYCNAHSFTVIATTMPAITNLSTARLTVKTNPATATNPTITAQDITPLIATKLLCGITGIEKTEAAGGISLSPNPASSSDMITLKWSENTRPSEIKLSDVSGRLVKEINAPVGNEISFDANALLPGLYFVSIPAGQKNTVVKKLLVTE